MMFANDPEVLASLHRLFPARTLPTRPVTTPPEAVRAAFRAGLALFARGRGGRGLRPETVEWARRIAAGEPPDAAKIAAGAAWHARHAVDRRPGWDTPGRETPGYVAFLLWGGAPGREWFNRLRAAFRTGDGL